MGYRPKCFVLPFKNRLMNVGILMRFQQTSVEESATIWQRVEFPRAKWPPRSCCVSSRWLILTTAVVLLCSAAVVLLLTSAPPLLSVPPPPFLCLLSQPLSSHLFIISVVLKLRLVLPPPVLSPVRTLLQVSECNWPSRQAPSLHNLFAVCKNMHNWLKQNPKNVCVITCSVRRRSHIESQPYYSPLSFYSFYCLHLHLNLF